MSNVKVSIIVPVYNVEDYVRKSIESLLSQTLQDLEVIAIDDGSPDRSGAILDELALTDSRLRVQHIQNGGVANARNLGIQFATGECIGFIDSDDYVKPDMFETLYSMIQENNADFAQCEVVGRNKQYPEGVLSGRTEILDAFLHVRIYNSVCLKLYKKSFLDGILFDPKKRFAEDFEFNAKVMMKAERVALTPKEFYIYNERDDSASHRPIDSAKLKGFSVYDYMYDSCSGDLVAQQHIREKDTAESLRFLDSVIAHKNIQKEEMLALAKRIKEGRRTAKKNRYLSSFGKLRSWFAANLPNFYILVITILKKLR